MYPWASLCKQVCSPSLNHGLKSMILLTWTDLWTNCTTIILYLNMLQNFNLQPMLSAVNLFMWPNRMNFNEYLFYQSIYVNHSSKQPVNQSNNNQLIILSFNAQLVSHFELFYCEIKTNREKSSLNLKLISCHTFLIFFRPPNLFITVYKT